MAEEKTLLLTQEAYDKMKEELAWREGEYRDEILSKVSAARARGRFERKRRLSGRS